MRKRDEKDSDSSVTSQNHRCAITYGLGSNNTLYFGTHNFHPSTFSRMCYNPAMQGRVYFRDEHASVTSAEFSIGAWSLPLSDILDARAVRRRLFPFISRYTLVIVTAEGEREALCHRNGYLVFQLAKALETALRETKRISKSSPLASGKPSSVSLPSRPSTSLRFGV